MTATPRGKLTPKQRVLKLYPEAFAHSWADRWAIYSTGIGGEVLGQAVSVVKAWKLAAMRIAL